MEENPGKRIIAIDYGEKRVGLAVSDPLGIFAIPLVTLRNTELLIEEIKKIIGSYQTEKIVLGYPLKEDGSPTHATGPVEIFEKELKEAVAIPIERMDERYSSGIAKEQIIMSVKSKKKRKDKSLVDKTAAAVILQDYLDGS